MSCKVALSILAVLASTLCRADDDCKITNATPVAGLSLGATPGSYTSSMTFDYTQSQYVVGANRLSISVSGCGAMPTTDPATWKFNTTGIVTVTMTFNVWRRPAPYGPPGNYTATDTKTYYVIRGPVELSDHERKQRREGRENAEGTQPVILDYFGTGEQAPRRATFKALLTQPSVTYKWSKSGPMAIDGSDTGESAKFYATGASARAGAAPSLAFKKVYDGVTYTVYDCTAAPEKAISCHVPADVRFYDEDTDVISETGEYGKRYLLYVVSNIGDPLREVNFQERYPEDWSLNGTSYPGGIPPPPVGEINASGSPFVSGKVNGGLKHPNYNYYAKD